MVESGGTAPHMKLCYSCLWVVSLCQGHLTPPHPLTGTHYIWVGTTASAEALEQCNLLSEPEIEL
jgi:hypothetical protein